MTVSVRLSQAAARGAKRLSFALLLALLGSAVCGVIYLFNRNPRVLKFGINLLKIPVAAGLVFFGVLAIQRLF